MTTYVIPITDNDGDVGRASFPVDPAAIDANLTSLYNAVDGVQRGTMGTAVKITREDKDAGSAAAAADANARKGQGFRVRWQESVAGLKRSTTIPCADATLIPGVDVLDISAGVGATLKAALEAVGEDPDTGGTLTVLGIDFVD